MKKMLKISSLLVFMVLVAGCAGKDTGSEVVDEAGTKTVQSETATAKTTDSGAVTADESTGEALNGQAEDQNAQSMTAAEDEIKSVYFDFDKFFIRSDMQEAVEKNAEVLNSATNKSYRVKIEGNCDEWGSDEYNYALGLKRANASKKALVAQGFDGSRATLVSLGEANPVCTDKTKECWQKNRRVDFKILP